MTTAGPSGFRDRRRPPHRLNGPARWAVWFLPQPVLVTILLVELAAVIALAAHLWFDGGVAVSDNWPWILAALVLAGIAGTEATLGVERERHRSDASPHIDLSSVWAFAAAVLLPGPLAGVVVAVLYGHIYLRVWRRTGIPPHRVLFSTATVVLAVHAAAATTVVASRLGVSDLFRTGPGLLVVLLALIAYAAVNMALVVAVIVLSGPSPTFPTFLRVLRRSDDAVLELATLSMGALVAGAMASFGPAYAVLVLPPLIVLHRTVLVRQLEEAANTDSKTGLLNAAAWHLQAGRELHRAEHSDHGAAVLVLDLDHFKQVNDRHGHVVGDHVLAAVAATVRAEVRDDDLVGRFGGEEFVVLLRGTDGAGPPPVAVAERIRARIAALRVEVPGLQGPLVVNGLSVSIGGATFPIDGTDLPQLLEVGDAAMYSAKNAGRNTVRMASSPDPGPFGHDWTPQSLR